jgi:hypothetical protein
MLKRLFNKKQVKKDELPNSVELISQHLSNFIKSEDLLVLHEKESEVIHSDIYIVKANEQRKFHMLLTCGMSALPMNVPKGLDYLKCAEITMLLPANWNLNYDDFADENNYWPIRALKQLSKYPHLNDTWLGYGHTIPLDDTTPANHNFAAILLLKSITLLEDFIFIETKEKEVYLYAAIPIYKEELAYAIEQGTDKLVELFQQFDIKEIVDINRKNVCE